MYRDDQEALQARVEAATREADLLRRENERMRQQVAQTPSNAGLTTLMLPPAAVYSTLNVQQLPLAERARLAQHALRKFPVAAIAILNVITFGIFPLIHFGLMHDRLPRAATNDPSSGKAIGFQFIPYYNLYWVFFSGLRLCDRLALQYVVRGREVTVPRGLVLAACVLTVIPYVNIFIGIPIIWTITVCFLQASVNEIADMPLDDWDATMADDAGASASGFSGLSPIAMLMEPTPEQRVKQEKAAKLVMWSHILGWGGLAVMLVGSMAAGILVGGQGALVVFGISFACVVIGAVVGQIGRGMQGRAI